MPLVCTEQSLNTAMSALRGLTPKQKQALLVQYLYREKNPGTVGQVVPGDALLAAAVCFRDCATLSDYQSMLIWIQRQEAIDAGAALGTFDAGGAARTICQLTCLSDKGLKAIEILLRCQLS